MLRNTEPTLAFRLASSGLLAAVAAVVLTSLVAHDTIASNTLSSGTSVATDDAVVTAVPPPDAVNGVEIRHVVGPGETFAQALASHGVSPIEIQAWQQAAAGTYDLGAVESRHALILTFTHAGGSLTGCEYEIDKYAVLGMRLVHGQIQARMKAVPRLAAVRGVSGRIGATLATSASAAGVPSEMVSGLADVFGWQVDLSDVHPGDEFRLLYSEIRDDGGAVHPGDILAAEITTGGRRLTAVRFENERGESEYYDPQGHALGSGFLKYPVAFTSITSGFGSRFHPVLKRRRPHLGVDFAAPYGTPVRAVATGVVTLAHWNGEYGNQVAIDHDAVYASSYSHLQRIARGIRLGATVAKGQVIGYVGRSGMATGPHLHFMLFKDGVYVNPLAARLPGYESLTGASRIRFDALRGEILERLAALGTAVGAPSISASAPGALDLVRSAITSTVN